jgi:DNA-binding transcriptional MocR family regulator
MGVKREHQAEGEPVYQKLAGRLELMIREGTLRAGERVPSVRQFSSQQGVSIPTALQAYVTLETRGLIQARPRSGFYVRAQPTTPMPQPTENAKALKITNFAYTDPLESLMADHANPNIVPLGAAIPANELLPGGRLARTMAAVARKLGAASAGYELIPGNETLRRELARRSLEWGCALTADDFIVTLGVTEAVSLALRLTCRPGDTVVVESPTYFGLARILREMQLKAMPIPVDCATGINVEVLEKVARRTRLAACVLMPNFHNPTGCLMPEDRKKRVVELLAPRGVPIIEDDIYGDLQHFGARPRCLKAHDPDGSVMLCGSYSKTLAPGYRVGYLAAGRWHEKALNLKRASTFSSPLLTSLAVGEFLRSGGYDRYLRALRQAYRQQVDRMRAAMVENFPAEICLSRPQGGFLLWCKMPERVNALELAKRARAAGISIAPGPVFSPEGKFHNYIRINCGCPWSARLDRSIAILGQFVYEAMN